jgi:hypothetical protein
MNDFLTLLTASKKCLFIFEETVQLECPRRPRGMEIAKMLWINGKHRYLKKKHIKNTCDEEHIIVLSIKAGYFHAFLLGGENTQLFHSFST